jgi:hypothetical protein
MTLAHRAIGLCFGCLKTAEVSPINVLTYSAGPELNYDLQTILQRFSQNVNWNDVAQMFV